MGAAGSCDGEETESAAARLPAYDLKAVISGSSVSNPYLLHQQLNVCVAVEMAPHIEASNVNGLDQS